MSDPDDAEAPEADDGEDGEQQPDVDADSPDGQPDLDADATADLEGLEVDADSLDPANASSDDGDDTEQQPDTQPDDAVAEPTPATAGEWGDMYVSLCTQTTNAIIDKHGDGHEIDENHFRSIDLDDHFNAVMEKYSDSADMEPEQALVVGTLIAVGGPVALHTDLMSDLSGEIRG